jgi:hypothetical protein
MAMAYGSRKRQMEMGGKTTIKIDDVEMVDGGRCFVLYGVWRNELTRGASEFHVAGGESKLGQSVSASELHVVASLGSDLPRG